MDSQNNDEPLLPALNANLWFYTSPKTKITLNRHDGVNHLMFSANGVNVNYFLSDADLRYLYNTIGASL